MIGRKQSVVDQLQGHSILMIKIRLLFFEGLWKALKDARHC